MPNHGQLRNEYIPFFSLLQQLSSKHIQFCLFPDSFFFFLRRLRYKYIHFFLLRSKKNNLCFFVFILHAHYVRRHFFQIFCYTTMLYLEVSTPQGLELHLDLYGKPGEVLPHRPKLTCLCQRGMRCTWTCPHYCTEASGASGPVYATGAAAAHGLVCITEACASPGLIYTTEACAAP